MTIVVFTRRLPEDFLGGAEIHALLFSQALVKHGHQVSVVTGGRKDVVETRGRLTIIRLRAFSYPYPFQTLLLLYWRFRFQRRVRQIVSESDIVHAFDLDSILLLSGWKAIAAKLVATVQDYSIICPGGDFLAIGGRPCHCHAHHRFQCHRQYEGNIFQRFYCRIAYPIRFAVRSSLFLRLSTVVFISRFVAKQFQRVFGKKLRGQMTVIGNFIPDSWLKGKRRPLRKIYDILFVGRVAPYKGIEAFLLALSLLVKRKLHFRACIVGAGNIDMYRKHVSELGLTANVSFTGEVAYPDIQAFYLQSKILVVPSIWPEPCGRTVIEGMGMGSVVIATDSGGTPELLRDSFSGFLVPAGDPVALSQKLLFVLTRYSKLSPLRRRARAVVRRRFLSNQVVRQYETIYQQLSNPFLP